MKVLQVSQEISQTLGGSFDSKCIYRTLLDAILVNLRYLMFLNAIVLRRYVGATCSTPFCNCHGGQDCLNSFTAKR